MFVGLSIGSAYFLISELGSLLSAVNSQLAHFNFEKFSLLGFGGFIGLCSFSVLTGAYLIGSPLQDYGQAIAIKIALAGLVIMIVGRIVGGYVIDYILISNGYQECRELIDMGPRHRLETWARSEDICEMLKSDGLQTQ
ncbi:hypothetical protein OLMES_5493 [Oleiphilus messinensis]|uniref:Uncharacterized protein n=2 Tax=Oleiphilus messinensis TaxID=141451 RepID=A0A1Y0IJ63_9GAMM|nr:hypothetical protein OLMES_5493 [Oleiphilus messinensis]